MNIINSPIIKNMKLQKYTKKALISSLKHKNLGLSILENLNTISILNDKLNFLIRLDTKKIEFS